MDSYDMYIGGTWCPAEDGAHYETENPFTGKPWATVAKGTTADVDKAVQSAHAAFTEGPWPKLSATDRGALLFKLGQLIDEHAEELAVAELRDNGKAISEVRGQMRTLMPIYRYYGGLADKMQGDVIPADEEHFLIYTRFEPYGVVAAITPWNSPLRLLSWKLAPALAAGNTVVIKPASVTSTSALELMKLVEKAGFPKGVVNVITGAGSDVGMPLVEHPLVAKVSFTGGTEAGLRVAEAAARLGKPATLELGGKSPNIIFADADLDQAAAGAVAGIFASAGQTCIAGSRLLVQENVHDEVVERVSALAQTKRMGNPMDPETEIGPVATRSQFEKIQGYVDTAKVEGATLITGGGRAEGADYGDGFFFQPTVFTDVDNAMRIAQEEVFGPVLSVIRFKDEDDAVRIGNDVDFGLAAGVWTQNLKRAHTMAARLKAGTVWINTYRKNAPSVPQGGYKISGLGREGGIESMRGYLQSKSVWVNLD